MPQNNKVTHLAVKIDAAIRKADSSVHNRARASLATKKKLVAISRHVAALRRQLRINTEGQTCPAL
jgi:hypothetical protein